MTDLSQSGGHDVGTCSAEHDEFVARRPVLLRIATSILDDEHLAEDVVQDVWIRWLAHHSRVDSSAAWLNRVTRNAALDKVRARRARPEVTLDPVESRAVVPSRGASPGPADHDVDLVPVLRAVVASLTQLERVVFVLRHGFEWSFTDIGDLLGRTDVAVRQLSSRARRHVQQEMTARPAPPGRRRTRSSAPPSCAPRAEGELVALFSAAADGGSVIPLLRALAPDVALMPAGLARRSGLIVHLVAGLVLVQGDRILLCRRSDEARWYPDVWDLPGSHLRRGETAEACVIRAGRAKLGIDVVDTVALATFAGTNYELEVRRAVSWDGIIRNTATRQHDRIAFVGRDEATRLDLADTRLLDVVSDLCA